MVFHVLFSAISNKHLFVCHSLGIALPTDAKANMSTHGPARSPAVSQQVPVASCPPLLVGAQPDAVPSIALENPAREVSTALTRAAVRELVPSISSFGVSLRNPSDITVTESTRLHQFKPLADGKTAHEKTSKMLQDKKKASKTNKMRGVGSQADSHNDIEEDMIKTVKEGKKALDDTNDDEC